MHITRVLMFYVRRRKIPGRLDLGKHQLVKPVTPAMKAAALSEIVLEQKNLLLLQRPYLTEEEEEGHEVACGKRFREFTKMREDTITKRMFKNYTMEEHLEHLNTTKKWE